MRKIIKRKPYLENEFLAKIKVVLITFCPGSWGSIKPAGAINKFPQGEKQRRRKKDFIVSSWNKWTGFESGLEPGRIAFPTLLTIFKVDELKILQTLQKKRIDQYFLYITQYFYQYS